MGAEGWPSMKVGPAWGSDLLHKPKDLRVPLNERNRERGEQRAPARESERQNSQSQLLWEPGQHTSPHQASVSSTAQNS